jgi:hypothetical protein
MTSFKYRKIDLTNLWSSSCQSKSSASRGGMNPYNRNSITGSPSTLSTIIYNIHIIYSWINIVTSKVHMIVTFARSSPRRTRVKRWNLAGRCVRDRRDENTRHCDVRNEFTMLWSGKSDEAGCSISNIRNCNRTSPITRTLPDSMDSSSKCQRADCDVREWNWIKAGPINSEPAAH